MTLGQQGTHDHPARCEITRPNHPECTAWCETCVEFVDWPNPDHEPSKRVRGNQRESLKDMHTRVEPAPVTEPLSGFPAGEAGSKKAATRWDDAQLALVDQAILTVAQNHRGGQEFTSDAIWAELDGAVPVTKGLTARLMIASRAKLIDTTGKFAVSDRGGHHDHGQRLSVWYSLVP